MNTHDLDGKLKDGLEILGINSNERIISREEFISSELYNDYVNAYTLHPNLQTILQDFNTSRNYDPTNNYSCEILLSIIVKIYSRIHIENRKCEHDKCGEVIDFLKFFHDQLNEMSSGMCAQGRTHRLLFVIFAFSK